MSDIIEVIKEEGYVIISQDDDIEIEYKEDQVSIKLS